MSKYDFDKIIDRTNTGSLKYDFAVQRGKPADVLPFWVADMDFESPQPVIEALQARVQHAVFGYSEPGPGYFPAVQNWLKKHYNWEPQEEWLTKTPGIVFALAAAVKAFAKKGEGVLVTQPVYYPFSEVIENNGRKLVDAPLYLDEEKLYRIDYELVERKIVEENVKLFLLCNPHNPGGRVWTADELRRVGDICLKHGVVIVSDEIHADFTWEDNKHTVFASLGEKYADNCIVCTAPSKTFNLGGLQTSNIFIPNKEIRRAFRKAVNAAGYSQLNTFGLVAAEAAYAEGEEWLREVKDYIYANMQFTREYIAKYLPKLEVLPLQGTYLLWIDCSALGLTAAERESWLLNEAGLWLDSGTMFGDVGEKFERLNVACPRALLVEGLEKWRAAYENLVK